MNTTPGASVVILTKNAGPMFREVLSQIYRQQTELAFEVIVVDSGSTDETLELIQDFPVRMFKIPPSEFNFGLTRNYGFSLARGKYIATISQDAIPFGERWLQCLIRPFFSNPNVVAVQGVQKKPENRPVFYWERRGDFHFTSETRKWIKTYQIALSFVNCAIQRAFWEDHQLGFTPWSEDKLFQRLIHSSGREIVQAEDAICIHGHEYAFSSLVRTLCGEGAGWKYAGVEYHLKDCLSDIIKNLWRVPVAFAAWRKKELRSLLEFLFVFLRPLYLFWGNRVKVHDSGGRQGSAS